MTVIVNAERSLSVVHRQLQLALTLMDSRLGLPTLEPPKSPHHSFRLPCISDILQFIGASITRQMSTAAKVTLATTSLSALGIVVFVHYQQRADKAVSEPRHTHYQRRQKALTLSL